MDISQFLLHLPERALLSLQVEATRYTIGTLGIFVLVWIVLAPILEQRKIRTKRAPVKQIHRELLFSLRTMLVFVALDIIIFDLATKGDLKIYTDIADYGWSWFVSSILVAIVLHDTYFYWVHRAMHSKRLYKLVHLVHHRSHNPTPFTAYSFSVLEAIIEYAYVPIMLTFLPMHGSALAIMLFIMIFKNATAHCGYELFPAATVDHPALKHLTTVTHHDMHHERGTGNFGFYFTWWDKWMGTEHSNYQVRFRETTQPKPEAGLLAS